MEAAPPHTPHLEATPPVRALFGVWLPYTSNRILCGQVASVVGEGLECSPSGRGQGLRRHRGRALWAAAPQLYCWAPAARQLYPHPPARTLNLQPPTPAQRYRICKFHCTLPVLVLGGRNVRWVGPLLGGWAGSGWQGAARWAVPRSPAGAPLRDVQRVRAGVERAAWLAGWPGSSGSTGRPRGWRWPGQAATRPLCAAVVQVVPAMHDLSGRVRV